MIEVSRVCTKELLALCHVYDRYDNFCKDLKELLSKCKNTIDTIYSLGELSHGEPEEYPSSVKLFYEEHKEIIDEINKYSHIYTFICRTHMWSKETSIYNYLLAHKDDMDKIIKVIEKLISLGIEEIEFSETFDFSEKSELMKVKLRNNSYIHFYDNMDVIPTYGNNTIIYKTTNSPYDIELKVEGNDVEFCTIKLNSLTFDQERLPKEISKEYTIDKIVELKNKRQKDYDLVKKLIDLRIANHAAVLSFIKLELEINKLYSLESKKELLESMKKTREDLEQIIDANKQYELDAISQSDVTEELLDKEEQAYQDRVMSLHI